MDGWKRYFTYAWPLGFMQKINDAGADVNLYIFNSNGNWNKDDGYSYGEYNIYNLPNLKDFDAILISVNNIKYPEVKDALVRKIRESGVPAISLETEFEGLHFLGIDNYDAMYDMTRHVLSKHGAKNVWYIAGPRENYEARERLRAFRDCMDEYGLSVDEADVCYSEFGFNDGIQGFDELMKRHGELPDAIICANDNIAVGVCARAEAMGLTVPDDFIVTGFDNFDKAAYYTPRITTVSRIREKIGYAAAETLLDIWSGKNPDTSIFVDYDCIYTESCGCSDHVPEDGRQYLKGQILGMIDREEIDERLLDFTHILGQSDSYAELFPCVSKAFAGFSSKRCEVVVDKKLVDFSNMPVVSGATEDMDMFTTKGYPHRMRIVYESRDNRQVEVGKGRAYKGMFPMLDDETGGNIFLFAPLHFDDKAVGYICVENGYYLMDKQLWSAVVSEVNFTMEGLFNKQRLQHINAELGRLSMRDPLTQLYNREGFNRFGSKAFDEAREQGSRLVIFFADLDRLKYINDNYGHELGDMAIRGAARALAAGAGVGSIPVRFGGDEFLVVTLYDEDEPPEEIKADILSRALEISRQKNLPFDISFSIGYVVTDPDSRAALDEYVREADQIMYAEKQERKAGRQ